jgi:hypothetical protein
MTCYHPNFIITHKLSQRDWFEARFRENNKTHWKFMKSKPYEYRFLNSSVVDDKTSDYWKYIDDSSYTILPVPCGCCIGCRLDYSRQWANRCYCESLLYEHNYFVTLTYDDVHLPHGSIGNATLKAEDMKKFMKDLRRYFDFHFGIKDIRFFGCGEYGDTSLRPHLHLILFNCPIPDLTTDFPSYDANGNLVITHRSVNGDVYYFSKIISDIWKKGNILIGQCTWQSCAYVARYVVKKQKGRDADVYESLGIEPPFVRMSRNPGVGIPFFKLNTEKILSFDSIVVKSGDKVVSSSLPRAFDKKIEDLYPVYFENLKVVRKDRQDRLINDFDATNVNHYKQNLEILENVKQSSILSLQRKL